MGLCSSSWVKGEMNYGLSKEKPNEVGPGSIPGAWAGFLEPIPYGRIPCSALMQGLGPAST